MIAKFARLEFELFTKPSSFSILSMETFEKCRFEVCAYLQRSPRLDGIRRNIMRVKRGFKARKRRKKVLKLAKGFRGGRSKLFRTAADAVDKALMYAYRDRRVRKRDFRRLWIARINAAARMNNLSYSKFIHGLKLADVRLDRKVLAELAVSDPSGFSKIANLASQQI